jgi:apolipoprotein N-acyltransferase
VPRLRLRARPRFPLALLISLLAGLCLSLAFPPAGIWPIAFVALVPLLWLIADTGPSRGFWFGLVFGLGFYGATLYWILRFGLMGWTALTLVSALTVGLFGLLVPAIRRPGHPLVTALGVAALWTLIDWLRSMWPVGGFTWGALGVSQVGNTVTVRWATVAGVWGVTFVVAFVNAVLAGALHDGARRAAIMVAALLVLAPIVIPFGTPDGADLDVVAVQVDVRQARSHSAAAEDVGVAGLNVQQDLQLVGEPRPDLVVWGEGALDPAAAADPTVMAAVRGTIATVGAPTLIGAVLNDPDGTQHTSELLFDGTGRQVDRYDKVHLVPFGEYVPFRSRLSWIDAIDQVPVDRVPGAKVHTVATTGSPSIGTPICYENSFPSIPRQMVAEGAGFLVVSVNNASYGFTAASEQHLQMSRMRAIETGRWVVNAAVSGISAFIDPAGHVVASEGLFEPALLRGTITSSSEQTWYVRLGDRFPWICGALVLVLIAVPRRRPTRRPSPEPLPPTARTLVILPTYDERPTIERVVRGVRDGGADVDVVVVDDASPDGTGDVVRTLTAADRKVRLVERPAKSGLASAYLEGFTIGLAGEYDLIVEMDSDLSHDPVELPRLLEAAAEGADLVVGSRYVPGGSVTNWSRVRVALSRFGNLYARWMLSLPLRDGTSGFRVYRRGLLQELVARPFASDGYGFQIELVMRANDLGTTLREVPITFREREHGHSKISRRIVAEALWLVTRWGFRRRFRPPDSLSCHVPP